MTLPPRCDVLVIGGGPAGSMAATMLARGGYDVLLVDKQRHPRYSVGESLIPEFWRFCDEAGVTDAVAAEGFVKKAGGLVAWQGQMRRISFRDFGYTRPALHVERDRFDQILLDHARAAGVRVCEEVSITRVEFGASGGDAQIAARDLRADGERTIRCRYVIDASGQAAVVGRQLGLRQMDPGFRFMSVWGYFTGSDYLTPQAEIRPAHRVQSEPPVTFVTSLGPEYDWGWSWHIMLREQTSVGLVLPVEAVRQVRDTGAGWESFFLQQCETLSGLQRLLAPARFVPGSVQLIRNYAYRSTQVAGPGFFLTGDSAGFVDPIFSVGVVLALYGGHLAAWAVDASLRDAAAADNIAAHFSHQLQGALELARTLALPNYGGNAEAHANAKRMAQFARSDARALTAAAALLINRSDNVSALFDDAAVQQHVRHQVPILSFPTG